MRLIIGLLVGLVSLACIALPAHAGLIETCEGHGSGEEPAPACTEIIENEGLPANMRAKAYAARAATYQQYSQEDAVKDMDKAIELMPKIADYYAKRAEYKKKLPENFKPYEILEDLTSAVNLDPKNADRYVFRAGYNLEHEDFAAVLPDLTKVIELKDDRGYLLRGMAYTRAGETSEAISDLNKSIAALGLSKKKNDRESHKLDGVFEFGLRGLNYMTLKQYDLAIADISVAISEYDHPILHIVRGNAFAAKKQYELAIEDYTKVLKEKPDQMEAYYLRANAYEQIGNAPKAAADRTKAALITAGLMKP